MIIQLKRFLLGMSIRSACQESFYYILTFAVPFAIVINVIINL